MFGRLLKEHREKKRYSIEELARLAGISRQTIWSFESGKAEPKYSTVIAISKALNVNPSIFFDKEVRHTEQKDQKKNAQK